MRIWLATVGEPLPIDGENVRLLRTGQYAEWLSSHGHEVVFWTGAMDHYGRRLRADQTEFRKIDDNYWIVLLAGRLYEKSISFDRYMNHREVAASFAREALSWKPPDVIIAAFPTPELCLAVADYAEARGIPFVVDARDFWPDIFVELLPNPLRFLAPLIFRHQEHQTQECFRRATAVSGMTESAMNWALNKAGREKSGHDFWHSFTYAGEKSAAAFDSSAFPDPSEIPADSERLKLCFFGTHSHRVNLEMFVDAFRILDERQTPVCIMLCGKGAITESLKDKAKGLSNVYFPGWLNSIQIQMIMSISDIGILPYNTPDMYKNIPNKIPEYLHGGLPILSCTYGEMKNLIESTGCGFWCRPEPEAIADTIEALSEDRSSIYEARANATRIYSTMFEQQAVFRRVTTNIENLVEDFKK